MLADYQKCLNKHVRYCRLKYTLSDNECEDLESSIILYIAELATHPKTFKLLENPRYLWTVVRNAAKRSLVPLFTYRNSTESLPTYQSEDSQPQTSPDLDQRIWFREVMDALSPEQQQVLTLYYGLNGDKAVQWYRQLARMTGFTAGQVQRLHQSGIATATRLTKQNT